MALSGHYFSFTNRNRSQVKNGAMWRNADAWKATYYNYYCTFTNYRSVYSGNQYRVKSKFKVYSGSNYETLN